MPDENFLLVSLKGDEAKKLAQVISNDTSRKILDYLAEKKDATESDIGKHLKLPLSTVHYNMQALLKARLVQADEFHYSEKGKEVNHYSLSNKYVIIAPKDAPTNLKARLRRILPVALITLAGAGILQLFQTIKAKDVLTPLVQPMAAQKNAVYDSVAEEAVRSVPMASEVMNNTASIVAEADQVIPDIAPQIVTEVVKEPNMAVWFALGSLFAILIFIIVDWIYNRRNH